jgi:hypothetical protein
VFCEAQPCPGGYPSSPFSHHVRFLIFVARVFLAPYRSVRMRVLIAPLNFDFCVASPAPGVSPPPVFSFQDAGADLDFYKYF